MAQIEAHIGDVSGGSQVAVGDYIVQIGHVAGGVVNILNNAPPPPRLRSLPVLLRPKVFPKLLDRQTETTTVIDALKSQQSVECTGEPGMGRTSLLRHLAHQSQLATVFPAGMVYFQVNQQSAPDLLKSLFDAFYICDFPIKPNETEMRHFLQSVNALVLLDDVEIDAQQVEYLMNIAPSCTFIAVTRARNLSTDVAEVPVKGLPITDAVQLFQNELGRTLSSEEENSVRSTCESVGCIPLRIMRAAREARDQKRPSSADEKKVLAALAVFSGTNVAAEHVLAVAGVQSSTLDDLEQRALVQSHDGRYALAPDVKPEQPGDQKPWFTRALNYFVNWTEQHRNNHALIAASGGAILLLLRQAVYAQSWDEVRRLGHASEEALTVTGKWDMWANVLDSIELGAKAQGDVAERAWVLHQLGTRALVLGDRYVAETNLRDALAFRELNDPSGAEVTRHNLDILLGPVQQEPDDDDTDRGGADVVTEPTPLWLKVGVIALVGLAALTVFLVWRNWIWGQTVNPPRIASFSVNPVTIPADGKAQLCYEVADTVSVRIEPNIGERRATKECIEVTASTTLTYTLTAFNANGTTATQQAILNVETVLTPPPVKGAEIVYFAVDKLNGPSGAGPQFRLCYHVRNAAHAEIDNNGGAVVLDDRRHCQTITPQQTTIYTLSATGADGIPVTRTATAENKPVPLPQIVSFTADPEQVVDDGTSKLCFQLKDATTAQLDPGARPLRLDQQCVNVRPLKRTTYTLKAFNAEGKEASADKTIDVIRSPKIVEFSVRPQRITRGGSVSVCFKVENASRVDIEPEVAKSRAAEDCVQQRPRVTTTYVITAFNDVGLQSQPRQDTVTVDEPPPLKHARILFFKASSQKIKQGETIELCYGVADANTTAISPPGREVPSVENNCIKQRPRESGTYTLKTTGEDNKTETQELRVVVEEPPVEEPSPKPPVRITRFEVKSRIFGSPQLCYALQNARRARIEPGIGDLNNLTNGCPNIPTRDRQTYTLTATGADGKSDTRSITFTPPEPPKPLPIGIISFSGPSRPIKPRSEARLCYSTLGEGTAAITPQPGRVQPSIRNCVTVSPARTTEYTLTVTTPQGEKKSKSLTVTVEGQVIQ
jgi:hypothetical protein